MLTRILTATTKITPRFLFGGHKAVHHEPHEHHDHFDHATDHGHNHHHVDLDPTATWVGYSKNKHMISLFGFQDKIDAFEHQELSDSYAHMAGISKFSLEYLIYDTADYHLEELEQMANEPHGYLLGDDPMDNRYSLPNTIIITLPILMLIAGFAYYVGGYKDYGKQTPDKVADFMQKAIIIEENLTKLLLERQELDEENRKLRLGLRE